MEILNFYTGRVSTINREGVTNFYIYYYFIWIIYEKLEIEKLKLINKGS